MDKLTWRQFVKLSILNILNCPILFQVEKRTLSILNILKPVCF